MLNILTELITVPRAAVLGALLLVSACSGSGGGSDEENDDQGNGSNSTEFTAATPCFGTPANPTALYAVVCYPLPNSNVGNVNQIHISGRIIDPDADEPGALPIDASDITSISVNGFPATLDPLDPTHWSITRSINGAARNDLDVEAVFAAGHMQNFSLSISTSNIIDEPVDVAIDPNGTAILLIDNRQALQQFSRRLVGLVFQSSGEGFIRSGAGVGTGTGFDNPIAIASDGVGTRFFIVDRGLKKILQVDQATGNRTLIPTPAASACTAGDGIAELCDPIVGVAVFDSVNNELLISDVTERAILAVNVTTGAVRLIADNTTTGLADFFGVIGMDFDVVGNLLVGYGNSVWSIDPSDGSATIVSSPARGAGPEFVSVAGLVYDNINNRALVLDTAGDASALYAVDLATGDRSIVSNAAVGGGPPLLFPRNISRSVQSGMVYIVDAAYSDAVRIDVNSGERSFVSGQPKSGPTGDEIIDTAWDYVSQRLLVHTTRPGPSGPSYQLLAADLESGQRDILLDSETDTPPALTLSRLGTIRSNKLTLSSNNYVQRLDLLSNSREVLANSFAGRGYFDYANNRVLGFTTTGMTNRILAASLGNGAVSEFEILDDISPLPLNITAHAYDVLRDRLIYYGSTNAVNPDFGLYAIDSVMRTATPIANNLVTKMQRGVEMQLDSDGEHVYVLKIPFATLDTMLRINLTTGAITEITPPAGGTTIPIRAPRGLYLDSENRRAFIATSDYGVVAMSLDSFELSVVMR